MNFNLVLLRGIWLGALVSVVSVIVFYRALVNMFGGKATVIDLRVLGWFAARFLGGMGIGFVTVIVLLVLGYLGLRYLFSA